MLERYLEIAKNGVDNKLQIPDVSNLTEESVREMHEVIVQKNIHIALDYMEKEGILKAIIPGIDNVVQLKDVSGENLFKDLWNHTRYVVRQSKPKLEIRWAALFHDFGKPETFSIENDKVTFWNHEKASVKYYRQFAKKYRIFSKEEYKKIKFLIYNLGRVEAYSNNWTESAVRRFAKDMEEYLDDIFLLARADVTSSNPKTVRKIQKNISNFKNRIKKIQEKDSCVPVLPKNIGHALIELGIPRGKSIGNVKKYLEEQIEKKELEPYKEIEYYISSLKERID